MGVSQQTINSYKVGRRQIPVSTLPLLAQILATTIDELLGETATDQKGKRGPTPKLQRQMDVINRLPRAKQKLATDMLGAIIQQAS